MKKTMLSAIAVLSLFCLGFTYDGTLNPSDFPKWEVINVFHDPMGAPLHHIVVQNPDASSSIKEVEVVVLPIKDDIVLVIAYIYECDGKEYLFMLNKETNNYDQVLPKAERT